MTAVVITYLFGEPQIALGRFIPWSIACIIGAALSLAPFAVYVVLLIRKRRNTFPQYK
jgi:hypothetical protein